MRLVVEAERRDGVPHADEVGKGVRERRIAGRSRRMVLPETIGQFHTYRLVGITLLRGAELIDPRDRLSRNGVGGS